MYAQLWKSLQIPSEEMLIQKVKRLHGNGQTDFDPKQRN